MEGGLVSSVSPASDNTAIHSLTLAILRLKTVTPSEFLYPNTTWLLWDGFNTIIKGTSSTVCARHVKDSTLFPSLQKARKSNFIYITNVRDLHSEEKPQTQKGGRKGPRNWVPACGTHRGVTGEQNGYDAAMRRHSFPLAV